MKYFQNVFCPKKFLKDLKSKKNIIIILKVSTFKLESKIRFIYKALSATGRRVQNFIAAIAEYFVGTNLIENIFFSTLNCFQSSACYSLFFGF